MKIILASCALFFSSFAFAATAARTCIVDQGCFYMTLDGINQRVIYSEEPFASKIDISTRREFHEAGFLLAAVTPANRLTLEASVVASSEMTVDQLREASNKAGVESFFTGSGCALAVYFCGNTALNPATWLFTKATCVSAGLTCTYALDKYYEWRIAQKKWNDVANPVDLGAGGEQGPEGTSDTGSSHSDFSGAVLESTGRLKDGFTISTDLKMDDFPF
ncbi:MAG: hypothetical protein EOP04_03190 [Proteobacteria bacterium]|nr:MAG: hypothetical protein EOP04_03190 [Pseudomonadota bacterium]